MIQDHEMITNLFQLKGYLVTKIDISIERHPAYPQIILNIYYHIDYMDPVTEKENRLRTQKSSGLIIDIEEIPLNEIGIRYFKLKELCNDHK